MVDAFSKLDLREALRSVWQRVWDLNKTLSDDKPWEKDGAMLGEYLQPIVSELRAIVYELQPFTPTLATKIAAHLATEHIEKITPLFPKLV
jgi:methionyl-tRNA synthetase